LSQFNNSELSANISSQRFLNPRLFNATIFRDVTREYDAFEKDIAVLNVFFESPTGVNFINVKCTNFLYECCFNSFYNVHDTIKKLQKQRSYEKFARLTLMKLTAVLQYTTKQSRTWIDFVSAVGGNGGLFIGFSLVTILEFIWILIQLLLIFLKPQEIAR